MCSYLLEMQQYYRWENGIPYAANLKKNDVGEWLSEREKFWSEIEHLPYLPLPLGEDCDPFESDEINRRIVPEGYVYSAGYGRFGKPHFFLGKLFNQERRGNYRILVSGCEYARDLTAPPAALQNGTIYLRREGVYRMIWERSWKNGEGCTGVAMEDRVDKESEAIILHELGEGMAGELLGAQWEEMLASAQVKEEVIIRAVRDLLADCLSALPVMIERREECMLHSYHENLSGMRQELFPLFLESFRKWRASGDMMPLIEAAERGREHWLNVAKSLLERSRNGEPLPGTTEFRL